MGVANTVRLLLVLLVILQSELDVLGERIGAEGGAADAIDLGLLGLGHCKPLKLLEHSLGTGEELGSLSVGQSLYLDHLVFLDVYQHGSGALEATHLRTQVSGVDDGGGALTGHDLIGRTRTDEQRHYHCRHHGGKHKISFAIHYDSYSVAFCLYQMTDNLLAVASEHVDNGYLGHGVATGLQTHGCASHIDKHLGGEGRVVDAHIELETLVLSLA